MTTDDATTPPPPSAPPPLTLTLTPAQVAAAVEAGAWAAAGLTPARALWLEAIAPLDPTDAALAERLAVYGVVIAETTDDV
jgi:hypothetical protein